MRNRIKLTERDIEIIIKKVLQEEKKLDENIFQDISDKWTGLKGMFRGYGMSYFEGMSKLRRLISKLKKLDKPNLEAMDELRELKNTVQNYNIPPNRKNALVSLIDNSIMHFESYDKINDQILQQIELLKLDKWK